MDRAARRTAPNRRKPRASSVSPQSTPETPSLALHHQSSASPDLAANSHVPHTAPQSRRGSKALQPAITFSTPGPGRTPSRRSRTMDSYGAADEEAVFGDDSPRKGGHSLRRRTRVDYTFEQADEDAAAMPNASASARTRKRRSDNSYDSEDIFASAPKRRGNSLGADTPSSRRRNPSRKSVEMTAYSENADEDNNDVQDTIEVGVSLSDAGGSDMRPRSHSHASSPGRLNAASLQPLSSATMPFEGFRNNGANIFGDKKSGNDANIAESPTNMENGDSVTASVEDSAPGPGEQLLNESSDVQPLTRKPDEVVSPRGSPIPAQTAVDEAAAAAKLGDDSKPEQPVADIEVGSSTMDTAQDESAAPKVEDGDTTAKPSSQLSTEESIKIDPVLESHQDDSKSAYEDQIQARTEDTFIQAASNSPKATNEPKNEKEENSAESEHTVVPEVVVSDALQDTTAEAMDVDKPKESTNEQPFIPPLSTPNASPQQEQSQNPISTQSAKESSTLKPIAPGLQPPAMGRWSHLTPYVEGEYVSYPEKRERSEDATAGDDTTGDDKDAEKDTDKDTDKDANKDAEKDNDKDTEKDSNDMEALVEDNDDMPDATMAEVATPALNTPTRGSPVPESVEPTASNSPAPGVDDGDEADESESQEAQERIRYFKYPKLRDPEDYVTAVENYEELSTADLYELLEVVNESMVQWQTEWTGLGKLVDDYENSLRRRVADTKYESKTRNLHQHGVNYEEPDFVVKGYKAKEKEMMSETRYLQSQDRIMAATYGFEYDPHPSKIGKQNPESQQVGIMTRGRSLRNQPRQTAKATEADEVTGKRQRKPVLAFDPAPAQDVSRSSTPVPTRGRRRRNVNADNDDNLTAASSFNGDANSDIDDGAPKTRRRRGPRPRNTVTSFADEPPEEPTLRDEVTRSGRRGRAKQPVKYDESLSAYHFMDEEAAREAKQPNRRLLTLKIPRGKNFSEPSSAITDNGDSRPSTASSESTSHTAESSYSFRPKRQKRFRDDVDENEPASQQPPRKRGKRATGDDFAPMMDTMLDTTPSAPNRKVHKIKVVRTGDARNGTPTSVPAPADDGDEPPKDYKLMTKSEKMSASMKSRWANGNMAGAVEKRKATLAAKKAAQAAADQKLGPIAPKPKNKPAKKGLGEQGESSTSTSFTQRLPGVGVPFSTT